VLTENLKLTNAAQGVKHIRYGALSSTDFSLYATQTKVYATQTKVYDIQSGV